MTEGDKLIDQLESIEDKGLLARAFAAVCERVVEKAEMGHAIQALCESNRGVAEELAEWFDELPEEEEEEENSGE